ncbi:MAG: potassium channel family protein [Lachnospiraceae bacterium]|jgi:trk system potassium uptake protein TrkA
MRKQYAVFGLGSFGESVAVTLQELGCEVVVVDNHMERIEDISPYVSYAVQADIEDPEVIRSLGARNLDGVVVAVADDMEASIMATLVSKEIGVPYVLAKAKNELHAKVLKKIGADSIIFPEKEIGQSVARNLVSGEFVDWISLSPDYSITEIQVPEKWIGKSLSEIDVRRTKDVNVVGVRIGEKIQVTIDPEEPLQKEMMMIMIGSNEALEKFGEKQVRE